MCQLICITQPAQQPGGHFRHAAGRALLYGLGHHPGRVLPLQLTRHLREADIPIGVTSGVYWQRFLPPLVPYHLLACLVALLFRLIRIPMPCTVPYQRCWLI